MNSTIPSFSVWLSIVRATTDDDNSSSGAPRSLTSLNRTNSALRCTDFLEDRLKIPTRDVEKPVCEGTASTRTASPRCSGDRSTLFLLTPILAKSAKIMAETV